MTGGVWFCCSCGVAFRHNMDADTHTKRPKPGQSMMRTVLGPPAKHVMCWKGLETGESEEP
jgi:hypothetical protein